MPTRVDHAELRPTRRTVVRTAAWTVPVLASVAAAPAFAASNCARQTLDFTSYPANTQVPSGSSATLGGVTVTLTYTGATGGTGQGGSPANGTVYPTTSTTNELRFYDVNASNTSQTITLTFSQPVKAVQLNLVDIDQSTNFDDRIEVPTAGYTYVRGGSVTGTGTGADPFRSSTGTSVPDGSALGNLQLNWAAALSQVQFVYRQGPGSVTGYPHIGIRTFAFTPTSC